MSYYCLASPYSGSPEQTKEFVSQVNEATLLLLKKGIHALSLTVHNDAIISMQNVPKEDCARIFRPLALSLIIKSSGLIVLTLDGWDKSSGIKQEVQYAEDNNVPVYFISYDEIKNTPETITNRLS